MSGALANAPATPRIPVFPIACWALGLVAMGELIVAGMSLAARLEKSQQVRIVEKQVDRIVPFEMPQQRTAAPDASVVAVAPPAALIPPPPQAPVIPQPTPIATPPIADPVSARLVVEGRRARVAGDMGLAITKLQEALKQSPDDPSVNYELGLVHEAMGIFDVASQHYEKVFRLGVSGAGALYELSAGKLRDGFEQPTDWLGKLALGRVRIFKDKPSPKGERVVLTIPVEKAPGEEVETGDIRVKVLFFNKTSKGEIVKLEDETWVQKTEWPALPFDFAGGEEPLRVTYLIPSRDTQTEHLFGQERYYGQVVTLSYKGEVLDVQAWPRDLAGRVEAPPSAAPRQQQDPAFDQLPPDFNDINPLLPTPEAPTIESLLPLPTR